MSIHTIRFGYKNRGCWQQHPAIMDVQRRWPHTSTNVSEHTPSLEGGGSS